jgi:predicted ATP-binding protein involved in virulence
MKTYIKSLHAKNIGLFDSINVEFSPDINIIIGANSTGKTSILKLLTYCFSFCGLSFTRFRADAEYWIDFHSEEKQYRAGTTKVVESDQDFMQFNANQWGQVPIDGCVKTFLPHGQVPYNLFAIGAYRYFEYQRIDGMKREDKGAKRKQFYDENNCNYLEKPSLPAIKQWMINRYFIIEKDWAEVEKSNWKSVEDFLPLLVSRNQNFRFSRIERDLEPIFEINGKECYLEELSGGFKSTLSVIFSIIDWCEGVNEGNLGLVTNACGTVLIDEIDAHLHPEWQLTIVRNLKKLFPKIQFIVTTHSPHVVLTAKENEVIRIPQHNGTLDLSPSSKSYKGWQISNILGDLMGVVESDELQANDILLKIDESLKVKDKDVFEAELLKLKEVLHPNDPILKIYEIKRSKLFLS